RSGVRRCGPAAGARRLYVRARGEQHPRLAGPAMRHRHRHRGRDCRAAGGWRLRGIGVMTTEISTGGTRRFSVSVTKDYLVFSSAHFITLKGHRCEGLHGHNYRASVTVEGEIDPEVWYVFDFIALKDMMRELCDEIDHKVLLPLRNPLLSVVERNDS